MTTPEKLNPSLQLQQETPPHVNTQISLQSIERRDWFLCPAKHQQLEKLPAEVRTLATSRSFARRFGLKSWLVCCGVPQLAAEQLARDAVQERDPPVCPLPSWHSAASKLLGPNIRHKNGAARDTLCSSGLVGLYFSAHWCPPCHHFTPELARFYVEAKASSNKPFEIVFVPKMHPFEPEKDTQEEYEAYYETMPWCTVPFASKDAADLKAKFGVKAIPCLVILNGDGQIVSKTGKDDVEVGLDPLGSVSLCLEAWEAGQAPKLPEKPSFSFSMDDDF